MSGNQGETKSGLAAPAVVIPQLNQAQSRALARGRTIGHYGNGVQASPFTLRQRAVYEDEGPRWDDGGGALFTARTKGVLRGIHEVGQHRVAAAPVIRAIGRRNIPHIMIQNPHTGLPSRMGALGSTTEIPTFLSQRILGHGGPHTPISDLTKTSLGALSKRKGKTRKDPTSKGGRRRKRRKTKRKRKRKRTKKFRKGSKSKTHRGKDFETRKTSKNYNSKRWKRMTGRRTRKSPLFPFV
jgi:hypothetical protein